MAAFDYAHARGFSHPRELNLSAQEFREVMLYFEAKQIRQDKNSEDLEAWARLTN